MRLFVVNYNSIMQIDTYTIELQDIHLYAHHGVMPQEREIGAWFTINIKMDITDNSSVASDEIDGTVSYADVYDIIRKEMETASKLLENVCGRISERLYSTFGQIRAIEITLFKDTPPMGGDRLKSAVTLKSRR